MPDIDHRPHPESEAPSANGGNRGACEAWRSLVGQIGAEVAGPLSSAMERIHILTGTGRIDRKGLRALRNEVDAARQAGLVAQQISRLASSAPSQSPEQLHLAPILKGVFGQRGRDIEGRGIQIRQLLQPTEVIADAPLLFSLLNTLLDWSLANARSHIEFRTDVKPWPARARLSVHFVLATPDKSLDREPGKGLDSLIWRLLEQTVRAMGLALSRHVDDTHAELVIEFPQTVDASVPAADSMPLITLPIDGPEPKPLASSPPRNLKPLIGSHVLVVASEREVRLKVREAIKHMGLIIDFVNTMEEATDFCRDGLPHALVYESALGGAAFESLRKDLIVEAPDFVFVELTKSRASSALTDTPQVAEDEIAQELPSALAEELSKTM